MLLTTVVPNFTPTPGAIRHRGEHAPVVKRGADHAGGVGSSTGRRISIIREQQQPEKLLQGQAVGREGPTRRCRYVNY